MTTNRLEDAIQSAARRFADELIAILMDATVDEIVGMSPPPPISTRKPGRPRKTPTPTSVAPTDVPQLAPELQEAVEARQAVAQVPVVAVPKAKPAQKKRSWPTCTNEECSKNAYGPSGAAKLCYAHHLEAGGKPSHLRKRTQKIEDVPAKEADAPMKRKTIRRKRGEATTADVKAIDGAGTPTTTSSKPDAKKRAEVLRELEDAGRKP